MSERKPQNPEDNKVLSPNIPTNNPESRYPIYAPVGAVPGILDEVRKATSSQVEESSSQASPENKQKYPEEKPNPLDEIQEKYQHIPLHEASARFKSEFLTPGRIRALQSYSGDTSINISLADEEKCPTAQINLQNGQILVSKSIALACLEGKRDRAEMFNRDLLTFIIYHEIGHFKDLVSPNPKKVNILPEDLEKLLEYEKSLNNHIWDLWENEFVPVIYGDERPESEESEDKEELGSPLHKIFFDYLNALDDCVVNALAIKSPDLSGADVSRVYRESLFKETDYTGINMPRCVQLGNYILQKMMNPDSEIIVDPDVLEELEKDYDIQINQRKKATLFEIISYLAYHNENIYGAKRYLKYYGTHENQYFMAAFERLLRKDLEQMKNNEEEKKNMEKFMKKMEEEMEKSDSAKKSKDTPSKGKGKKSYPNPFQKPIKDTEDALDRANAKKKKAKEDEKKETAEKSKTDSQRQKESQSKNGAKFANSNNLDVDKTQRYFEILADKNEEIEMLSNLIVNILLRNKMETQTVKEIRKKSGNLNVKDLIRNYSGIIAGESGYSTEVFDRKVLLDKFKSRNIALKIRLVLDNSGSMSGLKSDLEEIFVIISNAIRKANYKLDSLFGQHATLATEIILFGNSYKDGIEESGGRRIKEPDNLEMSDDDFHTGLIKAFGKISCDEGTDDSDAWKRIAEQWFEEGEVKAEGNSESISVALELTDGYCVEPRSTEKAVKDCEDLGINCFCAFFENSQALDKSEREVFEELTKKYNDLFNKASSEQEMEKIRRDFNRELSEAMEAYNSENQALIYSNPSAFWGDKILKISSTKDILPILLYMIMSEVNKVDEKLGKETAYHLNSYQLKNT